MIAVRSLHEPRRRLRPGRAHFAVPKSPMMEKRARAICDALLAPSDSAALVPGRCNGSQTWFEGARRAALRKEHPKFSAGRPCSLRPSIAAENALVANPGCHRALRRRSAGRPSGTASGHWLAATAQQRRIVASSCCAGAARRSRSKLWLPWTRVVGRGGGRDHVEEDPLCVVSGVASRSGMSQDVPTSSGVLPQHLVGLGDSDQMCLCSAVFVRSGSLLEFK